MEKTMLSQEAIQKILAPETELERQFLLHPEFSQGLLWGKPRFGHPEGQVVYHIREVLDNVENLHLSKADREKLRIVTYVHDTFKFKEHRGHPRDWTRHHAVLARQFLQDYTSDELLLNLTEFHDEAYYIWQHRFVHHNPSVSDQRLARFHERFRDSMQLYYLFFKCDTCTGDKNPAPIKWFESTIPGIDIVEL